MIGHGEEAKLSGATLSFHDKALSQNARNTDAFLFGIGITGFTHYIVS